MKIMKIMLSMLVGGMFVSACSSDITDPEIQQGNGSFVLSILTEDVETEDITRAYASADVNTFKVSLSDKNGLSLFSNKPYSEISDGDRTLPTAVGYQISVESCSLEESTTLNEKWGEPRFVGAATFDIQSNEVTPLAVECTMSNAGLMLIFDQSFVTKFPTHAATTQDARALVFKSNSPGDIAYYPLDTETGSVTLRLTGSAGGWSDRVDMTQNVSITKGKISRLTVSYDENSGDVDIEFETDKDMGESSDDVTVQ